MFSSCWDLTGCGCDGQPWLKGEEVCTYVPMTCIREWNIGLIGSSSYFTKHVKYSYEKSWVLTLFWCSFENLLILRETLPYFPCLSRVDGILIKSANIHIKIIIFTGQVSVRPTKLRRTEEYVVWYHTWLWGFTTGLKNENNLSIIGKRILQNSIAR